MGRLIRGNGEGSKQHETQPDEARLALESIRFASKNAPLSAEQLQAFAEEYPAWTVTAGIKEGKAVKTYERSFVGISTQQLQDDRLLRLSLTEPDCFDVHLIDIFDRTPSVGSGILYGSGQGDLSGGKFTISAYNAEPVISADDYERVAAAERSLIDREIVDPSTYAVAA